MWRALAKRAEAKWASSRRMRLPNTAWACATVGHRALLEAVSAEAAGRVGEFNLQNLANTPARRRATQRRRYILEAIAAEAAGWVGEFKLQELTNTVWAYATAGHTQHTQRLRLPQPEYSQSSCCGISTHQSRPRPSPLQQAAS